MTLKERLRQLASALPSDDSAVTMTRADLVTLLQGDIGEVDVASTRDLTVEEVADETSRGSLDCQRLADLWVPTRLQAQLSCVPRFSAHISRRPIHPSDQDGRWGGPGGHHGLAEGTRSLSRPVVALPVTPLPAP